MEKPSDLAGWKRCVSTAVLNKVKGVSGVGLPEGGITVYLEVDSPDVRAAVLRAVSKLNLPVKLQFAVTGKFERQ